jgi:hypothetical protein
LPRLKEEKIFPSAFGILSWVAIASPSLPSQHKIKPVTDELIWDIGFLALGAIFAIAGWILIMTHDK